VEFWGKEKEEEEGERILEKMAEIVKGDRVKRVKERELGSLVLMPELFVAL
jgi:hypothetical protein